MIVDQYYDPHSMMVLAKYWKWVMLFTYTYVEPPKVSEWHHLSFESVQ